MSSTFYECPTCRDRLLLRFDTRGGRLVEMRDPCRCERGLKPRAVKVVAPDADEIAEEQKRRRKAGICQDCDAPVEGARGKALRCAEHKVAATRAADARCRERHQDERRARDSERWHSDAAHRARKMARKRELHAERMATDPEYAAKYRRRRQRETLFTNPSREKYLATQRRHNANPTRRKRKRQMARAAYYATHPDRPQPVCVTCGASIPWKPKKRGGSGRPPKYCYRVECIPYPVSAARKARLAELAAQAVAA